VARLKLTGTIRYEGPFFTQDPGRTFAQNARAMMAAIAAEGEADVKARIASIPPRGVDTGETRRKFVGRVASHSGRRWRATAVIGIPNVGMDADEAIHTYAAMASIERRYGPVAATSRALRQARAINAAELLKGIA
jgi:hypothetical protein